MKGNQLEIEAAIEGYFRRPGRTRLAEAVRGHWGIESMLGVLAVTFREDDSRTRGNN